MKHPVRPPRLTLVCVSALTAALLSCAPDASSYDWPIATEEEGILLRSAHLGPDRSLPALTDGMRAPGIERLEASATGHFLIRFRGEAGTVRRGLEQLGARVATYLPHDAFLVTLTGAQGRRLAENLKTLGIDYLEPYHPALKIAPEVAGLAADEGSTGLIVHLFPDTDLAAAEAKLAAIGIRADGRSASRLPRLAFRLPAADIVRHREAIAKMPEVFWLEMRGEVRLLNTQAVPILQSGENGGTNVLADQGLHGEGQVVGYIDTGADYDSCYFRDPSGKAPPTNTGLQTAFDPSMRKIVAYDFLWDRDDPANLTHYDNHGHGTHVGGNIGGDNLKTPIDHDPVDGMATAAKFVVQDGGYGVDNCADLPGLGCPVVDLKPFFQQAYDQGARIHTNSWGDNENSSAQNNYSAGSEDVDAFMHEHPDFLLLFAAGNSGPTNGTVGSPSTAKNGLSVGGTQNGTGLDMLASFSSRGPTTDNRIKPDLLAPASNSSADSDNRIGTDNCGTDTGSGTSYASPLAAGAAALVRQYFMDGYHPTGTATAGNGFTPSAALVKATLLNSAIQLKGQQPFPSMDQGWGRIALDHALPFPGDAEKLTVIDGKIAFDSASDPAFSIDVQVTSSSVPLKVTLVWTDPPSTPAAEISLVNDLNLTVTGARTTFLGNVFRRGVSVTGGTADSRNNVEQVLLDAPRVGTYTIKVSPKRIAAGPQNFALVVRGGIK